MLKLQRKTSPILALVIVIIIGLIGFIAYQLILPLYPEFDPFFGNLQSSKKSPEAAPCGGAFFDSHSHLDDSDLPRNLAKRMQENGVTCAVIFVQMNPDSYDEDFRMLYEDLGDSPNVFIPFLDVVRDHSTVVTRKYLEKVYTENEGKFAGFGEFALYREELSGTNLTGEPWTTIFEFAGNHNLFIMIHLGLNQSDRSGLEEMLYKFPNTKVIIHGFEQGGQGFAELLKKHQNLYFTLDTATLMKLGINRPGKHLMYPDNNGSAQQFLSEYSENKQNLLLQATNEWEWVILAAPDRVMWGTDVSFKWHTDKEVYRRLIEFSKEFIKSLPIEVQNKYAYENAVRLFGNKAKTFEKVDNDIHDDSDEDKN
jgi:hypothetical protein